MSQPFRTTRAPSPGAAAGAVGARRSAVALAALAAVLVAVLLASTARTAPTASAYEEPSPRQHAEAERADRALWGEGIGVVTRVEWDREPGQPTLVVVHGQGFTAFAWPSLEPLRGMRNVEADPPAAGAALPAADQVRQAESWMRARFPWAARAAASSWPVGDTGRRVVSWRHVVDAVLMPMRLDIVVDRAGGIVSFSAVDEPDPPLPPVAVDEARARAVAAAARPGPSVGTPVLLAVPSGGGWRPAWSFPVASATSEAPGAGPGDGRGMLVDAATGELLS
ncbi:hypothetical protein [Streptomyces sp. KS 21]|uniref:hypothetical protein n=1 Tax=Streptomyces sp. KS 21 TaxID=2485150 RepID=UPI0010626FA2|nr:hypothetical protein [Streptomyces sp. KS 21]TDU74493.1 hypothetical protein EDD91_1136 [Streptomyces sp. KS 21]